jgi:AraC-like DNA-binding protein
VQNGSGPRLRFHLPDPGLRDCVSSYYSLEVGDGAIDDRLHPEWANIRFALRGDWTWSLAGGLNASPAATLFGPTGRSARITGNPRALLFGIGLLPMGWARLVQVPATLFANRVVPLSELWGNRADRLHRALANDCNDEERVGRLDELLLQLVAEAPPAEPHLAAIHRALASGDIATVSAFAAEVGVTQRTLERLCPKLFGFAPKPLLRRQRFLRSLDRVLHNPGRTLTELLEESYADQSHFVREFKAFMGLTPTAYFAEPRTMMRLAGAERERVVGQTMQGLHLPPG